MDDVTRILSATNNPTEGAKWTLVEASDLSNTGWITGNGIYDPDGPGVLVAETRAYLLDAGSIVPAPSALALLSLDGPTPRSCAAAPICPGHLKVTVRSGTCRRPLSSPW